MILVDSSAWITHLRGRQTDATAKLGAAVAREPVLIGALILLEIVQGARDELHAAWIERDLRRFAIVSLLDDALAPRATLASSSACASPFSRPQTSSPAPGASSTAMR